MKIICIIEDDSGIANSLKLYLENSDFQVFIHDSGEGAYEFINTYNADLVVLDINLPKKDGISVCKQLRETSMTPVIMLTARGNEVDRITGLEVGADDYIAKPFSPRELLARIQSILRRSSSEENSSMAGPIQYENIEIFPERAEVLVDGVDPHLTGNEYDILVKIVSEKGNLVSRETLMKEVIGYDNYVYDRTIDTHIKNLRKKLGNKDIVLTIRGKGYRLNT